MTDRETVIAGLEHCITDEPCCGQKYITCPYTPQKTGDDCCARAFAKDVLALLKEQEAVEPILEQDSMVCGNCGHEVIWQRMIGDNVLADEQLDYCPKCGRRQMWNE